MNPMQKLLLSMGALVLLSVMACTGGIDSTSSVIDGGTGSTTDTSSSTDTGSTTDDANTDTTDTQASNGGNHDDLTDYVWDEADVVEIVLSDAGSTVSGSGATVAGDTVTITTAGTYRVSGTLSDGELIIDADNDALVRLILNGITLHSSSSSAIYAANADKVVINLADGTESTVSDGTTYALTSTEDNSPNAAVFSTCDMTIFGTGMLSVVGNCKDGITSKDGLIIDSGTFHVQAEDDGIRGKDYLIVKDGSVTVEAGGDGLLTDNDSDTSKGYITIQTGTFTVTAGGDALTAQTDLVIADGDFVLESGGGSGHALAYGSSAKGLKGLVQVVVDDGTFNIDAADDAVHSNATITINGGTWVLASGDDGLHADTDVTISGGTIRITECYEGIGSGETMTLTGGNVVIHASDDGLNLCDGVDGSGFTSWPGHTAATTTGALVIAGGRLVIYSGGDGIDVSGSVTMSGGVVLVHGPTSNADGALDHTSFIISGGLLVAVGSSGMAQAAGTASSQCSLMIDLRTGQAAGTLVHIQTQAGTDVLTFAPAKTYQSVVFSSADLSRGTTYAVYLGGSADGTPTDGLYEDGTYSGGTRYTTVTLTSQTTVVR